MPKTVTVTNKGKSLVGFYRINKKVLTVTSTLGQKSTKLGRKDPESEAKQLLSQMMEEVGSKTA
jgi:hypothetical protein